MLVTGYTIFVRMASEPVVPLEFRPFQMSKETLCFVGL
jgi:hypothetical protein